MSKDNVCGNGGCGCSTTTTAVIEENAAAQKAAKKAIEIEYLYVDLNVCQQCKGDENNLEEALRDVSLVLEKTGTAVNLKKIHVESLEQAQAFGFFSSPTIRVDGRDAAIEVKENYCSSCSEQSGDETYCREWNFQGEKYSTAPKPLVVEAVLKEIYGGKTASEGLSPEQKAKSLGDLKRFFEGDNTHGHTIQASAPVEQITSPGQPSSPCNSGGCGCS